MKELRLKDHTLRIYTTTVFQIVDHKDGSSILVYGNDIKQVTEFLDESKLYPEQDKED